MVRTELGRVGVIAALVMVSVVACQSGQTTVSTTGHGDAGGCDGGQCAPHDGGGGHDTQSTTVTSLKVVPATADIVAADGATPEKDFHVQATYADGHTGWYGGSVEYSLDSERVGYIGPTDGAFIANGIVGGQATITATPLDGEAHLDPATATVTVHIERTIRGDGVADDVAQSFVGTMVDDPARAAKVVYPLDGALMPENVYPADIQWINGAQDDLFQIRLTKPSAQVTAYIKDTGAGFGNHWLADADAWRSMAQSDPDQPMRIAVTRLEAASGDLVTSPPVEIRFARGTISGSVYYWDIAAGHIVRIDDGTATREQFMPNPPPGADGNRCVGCHSVSHSGRYMVGRLGGGDNIGNVFDLTKNLTQDPVPTEFPLSTSGPRWWFSTWSPDDSRLMVSQGEGGGASHLALMDPFSGQILQPQAGTLPGGGATQPSWSPDGSLVAYIANIDTWGGANTRGDVAVVPVTGQDSFGAAHVIRAGADVPNAQPAGQAASYPTWTPDSQWLAFAHGSGSRSETMQDALYFMRRDGTDLVRLDKANGGPNTTDTFQPRFSPFETKDYFWLSYLSRRDYGNAQVGTRGSSRQQIWVSAIAKHPTPGQDPSEVGYWLPGQDTASMNIAAYWAPQPCRHDAEACSVGGECCSGECLPGQDGALVCSPPPPERCRRVAETCSTDADCCDGLFCAANVCYPHDG